jgi:hypothetical protein
MAFTVSHVGTMVLGSLMVMVRNIYISASAAFLRNRTFTPSAMEDSLSDGSSVRIKAARHTINKRLDELESRNPQIKVGDWKHIQALPQYGIFEHEDESESLQLGDDSTPVQGEDEPLPVELPPIIPTLPDGGEHVSWNDLHNGVRGIFHPTPPGDPHKMPKFPHKKPIFPPGYRVAIIGAGVAGLRTAMLLQRWGIPYKIFEASKRHGGRLFTYRFSKDENDYYDVGAMRFPMNDSNQKTFALFDELGLTQDGKVVDYVFSNPENIRSFNSEC